jgi:TRAP-type mannitol/chloroaromatic compound transport system permease small subunit
MQSLIKAINGTNEWVGRVVSWVTTALVLLICYDVAMRYIFSYTKIWIAELEWHMFALIFLLAAAYTFLHDQHVRVDVFYARYAPKRKAWVDLIGIVFFLIPFCLVVIYTSAQFTYKSFLMNETSADPGGLSHRFLIKGVLLVGFVLLLLQALAAALNALLVLRGKTPVEAPLDPAFEDDALPAINVTEP